MKLTGWSYQCLQSWILFHWCEARLVSRCWLCINAVLNLQHLHFPSCLPPPLSISALSLPLYTHHHISPPPPSNHTPYPSPPVLISREKLLDFLWSVKQPDGSFVMHVGGEVDVRWELGKIMLPPPSVLFSWFSVCFINTTQEDSYVRIEWDDKIKNILHSHKWEHI